MPFYQRKYNPGNVFGVVGQDGTIVLDHRAADFLNDICREMERLGHVRALPPLTWQESGVGRRMGISLPPKLMGLLSGAGNPYTFVEQIPSGTGWADAPGGFSGTAYEANGVAGLAGKVVRLVYEGASGDWRWQHARGLNGCNPANTSLVITVRGCAGGATRTVLPGAAVTVTLGGATVASGTTDGSGQFTTPILTPGTYVVSASHAYYQTGTQTVTNVLCSATRNVSLTLAMTSGYICCNNDGPFPPTLFMTCSQGTFSMVHSVVGAQDVWDVALTVTMPQTLGWRNDSGLIRPDCTGTPASGSVPVSFRLSSCVKLTQGWGTSGCWNWTPPPANANGTASYPLTAPPPGGGGAGTACDGTQAAFSTVLPMTYTFPTTCDDVPGSGHSTDVPITGTVVIDR